MRRVPEILWRNGRAAALAAAAGLCAVPLSIALSETFLAVALIARIAALARRESDFGLPRVFWFWVLWAGIEIRVWVTSPAPGAGTGEIRHLLLIGALFLVLPALKDMNDRIHVWQGLFVTSTMCSAALIVDFLIRAYRYRSELAGGGDPGFYLRNGGFLHHWMIYATVEVLVFGALLEYRAAFPEWRRWTSPALAVTGLAILLSLTRALWLTALLILTLHLIWRRSKWVLGLPILPVLLWITPGPVHSRVVGSLQPEYYSNAERVQMWRVSWKMVQDRPWSGIGPGRVDASYTSYLAPGEPVPAYHGHLHNNAVQLAAAFGLPVLGAAVLCLSILWIDLWRSSRLAGDRESRFVTRAGLLGVVGFVSLGMADYTYGHSLGLILLSFVTVFDQAWLAGSRVATSIVRPAKLEPVARVA